MSLEDEIQDVVGKAMRGVGMSVTELAHASGLFEAAVKGILDGEVDAVALRAIAPELGLDAQALVGLADYLPEVPSIAGVERLEVPFRDWTVNAWLLELGGVRVLFDTGWNAQDVFDQVGANSLDAVFITHPDPDHIGGVDSFINQGVRVISETEAQEGGSFRFGEIEIQAMDLSGHCVPATGYFVSGFEEPLWIVGDAVFAGSMGGCPSIERFQQAFATLRNGFSKFADYVLILPGHGPMTSVGNERVSNPFQSYFKKVQ